MKRCYEPSQSSQVENPGYHLVEIPRGELGKASKLREEIDELEDAEAQGSKILAVVELSDLVGAIKLYLELNLPGITLADLEKMADITARAFKSGRRK